MKKGTWIIIFLLFVVALGIYFLDYLFLQILLGIVGFIGIGGIFTLITEKQARSEPWIYLGMGVIGALAIWGCISLGPVREKYQISKANDEFASIKENPSVKSLTAYIEKYKSKYEYRDNVFRARTILFDSIKANGIDSIRKFQEQSSFSFGIEEIIQRELDDQFESLYNHALKENTFEAWAAYQDAISEDEKEVKKYLRDSHERMEELAANNSDIAKKLIDREVEQAFKHDYTSTPKANRIKAAVNGKARVKVDNLTKYSLIIRYSGPDSRKLIINPKSQNTINLTPGTYRCFASVDGDDILGNTGIEKFEEGEYEISYRVSNPQIDQIMKRYQY